MRQMWIILLLPMMALVSCYEGWEYKKAGHEEEPPEPPDVEPIKPYSYILYEMIYPTVSALKDAGCFSRSGTADYRMAEISDRISALSGLFDSIADKVVFVATSLSAADCTTLSVVQASSVNAEPWGNNESPLEVDNDRPLLHFKAVLSDEEPSATPPDTVLEEHWAAWQQLLLEGLNVRSATYFIYTTPINGYFSQWYDGLSRSAARMGTVIDPVDPSTAGEARKKDIIEQDTLEVENWLLQ